MNIQDKYKTDKDIVIEFMESILKGSITSSELKSEEVMVSVDLLIKAAEKASEMVYGSK